MAALWFFKLFRNINPLAAWATGIWGTVNAVVIMVSAMSMGVAIKIANGTLLTLSYSHPYFGTVQFECVGSRGVFFGSGYH